MQKANVTKTERRIGDQFIKSGLISEQQLEIALKRQAQTGDKLGSILVQLGYITTDNLLEFLKDYYQTPSIDLFNINIEPMAFQGITLDLITRLDILPVMKSPKLLFVAMTDPKDSVVHNELEFILGCKVQPVTAPSTQIQQFITYLSQHPYPPSTYVAGTTVAREMVGAGPSGELSGVDQFLRILVDRQAADLLISAGLAPCLKVNSEVERLPLPQLTPAAVEELARALMTEAQWITFMQQSEVDFGILKPDIGRFRVNAYRQRSSISIAIRSIADRIPTLSKLGFVDDMSQFLHSKQGLILVCGPTGHGKSTTIAAMVDFINRNRKCNIITLEDPIEFLHKHKHSNVNQRELGRDTKSFKEGLKHIFRQAPDVIVIGEMRDADSFEIAVQAASSGHLVISTLHASNTTNALERVIDICPAEKQELIRGQLVESLLLCISQRLVPAYRKRGMVLAYEHLSSSPRIKSMIRENRIHQIRTMFQQSIDEYASLDICLNRLIKDGLIEYAEALKVCENPNSLRIKTQNP